MRCRAAIAPLLLSAVVFACSTSADDGDADQNDNALSARGDQLDVTALVKGLMAAPGSKDRAATADVLRGVMGTVKTQIPISSDAKIADQQRLTLAIMDYTAEYLKTGETCDPSQKIRVFRGIGTGVQPVLRPTADSKQGLTVAKPFMDAMRKLGIPVPGPSDQGMAALNGVQLHDALVGKGTPLAMRVSTDASAADKLNQLIDSTSKATQSFSDQSPSAQAAIAKMKTTVESTDIGFSYRLGFKRSVQNFQSDSDTPDIKPVNLSFDLIALDHTQGAPWGGGSGSPFSPLISTSIENDLDKFGPFFLVADVCPERALFATADVAPEEREVYVPLFILPEEVVAIVAAPATIESQPIPSETERPLSAAYRRCLGEEGVFPSDGMGAYADVMRGAVVAKSSLHEVRAQLTQSIEKACTAPTTCPSPQVAGKTCVASKFCADKGLASDAVKVGGLPCVVQGAAGCQACK